VGGGGAARALDRGWEAAVVAVDGEPRQRRGSDEVWSSGKRKAVEMEVRECKSEFVESSGTCFRSKRGHGRVGTAAGNRRGAWHARAAAARRGGARRGPAEAGKRQPGCWCGMWCEERRRGAAGARKTVGEGGGITSAGQSRGGLEVDEGGPSCNS
jgi:hypothetical protein